MQTPSIRLYVDAPLAAGARIECSRSQANYLVNVMRMKTGDELALFNGRDGEWLACVQATGRGSCDLEALSLLRPQQDGPDIHYLFAPLKRARLDYMVQKATEMGVSALCPVITARTEVSRVKLERMRSNAIEAAEQCRILHVPEIHEAVSLATLLDGWDETRRIIYCDEEARIDSPLVALKEIAPGPLAVLIGPEGGFDEKERERLRGLNCVTAISLGPRVMRADTAAVAALSLVNAALGDWR